MGDSSPTPRSFLLSLVRRILDPALSSIGGPPRRAPETDSDGTTLSTATPEHLEAIRGLYEQSFHRPTPSAVRRAVRFFPQLSLVALRDRHIAGFAVCRIRPRSFLRRGFRRSAFLVSIVIEEESRGRGLGRAMLVRLLDVASSDLGLPEMGLEVDQGNEAAVALYASMGFRVVPGIRGITTPGSVYMARPLDERVPSRSSR